MPDGSCYHRFDPAPLRVLLLLPSLHGGGAERVAVHLANRIDRSRFDLKLGLLRRAGPYLGDVDPSLVITPSGSDWLQDEGANADQYRPGAMAASALRGPRGVAEMVAAERPEVVMSFLKGMSLATWIGLGRRGPDRPVWIAREGNNTDAVIDDELPNPLGRAVMKRLVRRCYRAADCFLAISHDMAETLQPLFGLDPARMRAIHNPVDVARVASRAREPLQSAPVRPFVVTVGRLEHQKGQDLLLRAFAASPACRDLDLVILGKGSQEAGCGLWRASWAWPTGSGSRASSPTPGPGSPGRGCSCCPRAGRDAQARSAKPWPAARRPWSPTASSARANWSSTAAAAGSSAATTPARSRSACRCCWTTPPWPPAWAPPARTRALQFDIDRTVGAYSHLFLEQAGREPALAMAAE